MKTIISTLLLSLSLTSCVDMTAHGFYWSPSQILKHAEEAITDLDEYKWQEATKDHALCKFGTTEGLKYLRKYLPQKNELLSSVITKTKAKNQNGSEYSAYFIYFKEVYSITLPNKLNAEIVCDYGMDKQNSAYTKYPVTKMQFGSCAMTRLILLNAPKATFNSVCDDL